VPIYEFKCQDCGSVSSIFIKSIGVPYQTRCQRCSSRSLERAVSRFAYHRAAQAILEEYGAEPQRLDEWKDPRQIGRWTERKFQELGLEVPKGASQMIDAAREGELREPIKDL